MFGRDARNCLHVLPGRFRFGCLHVFDRHAWNRVASATLRQTGIGKLVSLSVAFLAVSHLAAAPSYRSTLCIPGSLDCLHYPAKVLLHPRSSGPLFLCRALELKNPALFAPPPLEHEQCVSCWPAYSPSSLSNQGSRGCAGFPTPVFPCFLIPLVHAET